MKLSILKILFIFALPINAHDYYSSYRINNKCYGKFYKEKLIPGSYRGRKNTSPEKKKLANGENHA